MAIQVKNNINLNKNYLINAGLERLTTQPTNPRTNQIYVDANENLIKQYNGTEWVTLGVTGALVYKGTVGGTGATVSDLPQDDSTVTPAVVVSTGDTYIVAKNGEYSKNKAGDKQYAYVGDMFTAVKDATTKNVVWTYIPAGNDSYTEEITGDGSATDFTIKHGLNTLDVSVYIYDTTTGEQVLTDIKSELSGTDYQVVVSFAVAPETTDKYRVVIHS